MAARKVIAVEGAAPVDFGPRFSSPAILGGNWLFCSGVLPTDFRHVLGADVEFKEEALSRRPDFDPERLEYQAEACFRRLDRLFSAAGADLATDCIRIDQTYRSAFPDADHFVAGGDCGIRGMSVGRYLAVKNAWLKQPRPPSVGIGMTDLPVVGNDLQVVAIGRPGVEKIGYDAPPDLPAPVAGYAPATCFDDWVSLAGELPTDWRGDWGSERTMGSPSSLAPEARHNEYFWYEDAMEKQVDYVLHKISRVLEVAGSSFQRCVHARCYIGHPSEIPALDRVWRKWFPDKPPARTIIPFVGLGGLGTRFECSLDFIADDSELELQHIETELAPPALGHASQAVKAGEFVFFSGLLATDAEGRLSLAGKAPEGFEAWADEGRRQMNIILENLAAISEAAGTDLANTCRIRLFCDQWQFLTSALYELEAGFPQAPPAVSLHRVNASPVIVPGCHLMADVIGFAP